MSDPTDPENYEDVSVYDLDADVEEELLLAHNECTFIWANKEGWPVGVIMSYVWRKGAFWLTLSSQRARVPAMRRDNRCSICVTSRGSGIPGAMTVTYKGTCEILDDADLLELARHQLADRDARAVFSGRRPRQTGGADGRGGTLAGPADPLGSGRNARAA